RARSRRAGRALVHVPDPQPHHGFRADREDGERRFQDPEDLHDKERRRAAAALDVDLSTRRAGHEPGRGPGAARLRRGTYGLACGPMDMNHHILLVFAVVAAVIVVGYLLVMRVFY